MTNLWEWVIANGNLCYMGRHRQQTIYTINNKLTSMLESGKCYVEKKESGVRAWEQLLKY